ncbi:3-oxoacyl-[acyl-carrier-protein] reductase [compost metagenome]|jgi:3-oxoacyl-[acyl-carrier protein] reductase
MKNLQGKTALITGAGRGIGRCVALKLAAEGARVVLNDLDAAPVEEVLVEIRAAGGEAIACIGSVTAEDFAERFVNIAVEHFGGIDIIVNNAGYGWGAVIQKATDEQWYAMLDCHMTAPFRILRAAQPIISAAAKKEAAEGREVLRKVVNISSILAGGGPGQVCYSSAKAGLLGMTKTLAKEWGRLKVNVNAVAFGVIDTRLTRIEAGAQRGTVMVDGRELPTGLRNGEIDALTALIPLGRGGSAEEAAGAVYLLCAPESDYVSGQTLVCSGGYGNV